MQMFHMSSMKMGLDQAVLKGFESGSSGEVWSANNLVSIGSAMHSYIFFLQGALTKEEVEKLLRHGAYEIFNEDKAGSAEAESNSFVRQDLDSILQRRSRTVVHDKTGTQNGAAGSTFSKASFKVARTPDTAKGTQEDVDIEDPDFWKKMVGEGQADDVADDFATKRQRKETNYSEKAYLHSLEASLNYSDDEQSDSESDESSSTPLGGEMTKWGGMLPHEWKKDHVDALLQFLLRYGYGHFSPKAILEKFEFGEEHGELEVRRLINIKICLH
jgi:chromodomain-helicase-DNA-binding protein 7